jgi:hypothetical protein
MQARVEHPQDDAVSFSREQLTEGSARLPTRGGLRPTPERPVLRLAVLSFCCAVILAAAVSSSRAQPDEGAGVNREYTIKAAYLYNFSSYVQWPAEAFPTSDTPLVIGVLGTDPFGEILNEIVRTKKVAGRPIVARRFASMAVYAPCHVLFVPSSTSADETAAAIRKTHGSPVLLVGENPGFAAEGGNVNFFIEENKVRFEINVDAARRRQLKISSKLLGLAKIVGAQQP